MNPIHNFHQVFQGNGSFFTVPVRYVNLHPFCDDKPNVVQAYDIVTQRPVVIKKVLLPDTFDEESLIHWKRCQRELYCMLYIEQDNIVKLFSTFTQARNLEEMTEFYIVREYMEGTMKMLDHSRTDHFSVKSMFFDICKAIEYLHSLNISHRDLKPQNILMCKSGDVKICDFGHSNSDDPFANTPYIVQRYYRAPEIICENRAISNNIFVDIWSLGCIFGELLTGQVIFKGTDYIDQFYTIVRVLGSPDPIFFSTMNVRAREFMQWRVATAPVPPSLEEQFPDHCFLGSLPSEPEQCRLARDLLSKMIVINPNDRIDIHTILAHPYLEGIWDDNGEDDTQHPEPSPFLRRFFAWSAIFNPNHIKEEIYQKIFEFGQTHDIFTGAKN